jgi:predicted enzyme related to lactoylglutathione lyase
LVDTTPEVPMDSTARLDHVFESMKEGIVPASRTVPDLSAALDLVRRLGGSIASEMRTAPGVGSWAFVAGADGRELLLWEDATAA